MSALAHDFGSNSEINYHFGRFLKNLESIEPLFDALSSVVFFIKNTEARYVFVNQTLVNRCGLKDKTAILGKTSSEVFPHSLGKIYTSQDLQVIRRGKKLTEQLELHLYAKISRAGV